MKSYNGFTPAQRMAALHWLKREYSAGRRTPPQECQACKQRAGIIEAHSENYAEPYGDHIGAFAFCFFCHMMIHCRFSALHQWNTYRDMVAAGYQMPPTRTRDFKIVKRFLSHPHDQPCDQLNEPRSHTVLDDIHQTKPQEEHHAQD
jgi:hypothetical protein